jgi:hypothetical protein
VAIAAMAAWICTVAVGVYLLLTSTRSDTAPPAPAEHAMVPQAAASAQPQEAAAGPAVAGPARAQDRFDPPSLAQAKSEPLPGLRALAEFTHPALAITGCAFWLIYTLSRDRIFAAIGTGILLGAIGAGLSWAVSNARAAKRERAAESAGGSAADANGQRIPALFFSRRLMMLHGAGAALTLLLAALIVARV